MISARVARAFCKHDSLLVFPSEVAARFWQRWLAAHSGTRAIRLDRCLSWDSFKERFLSIRSDRRPASKVTRIVFATRTLAENATEPFLGILVSPQFARYGGASAGALARSLPVLHRVVHHPRFHDLDAALVGDYRELFLRYSAFLDANDSFEPEWETAQRIAQGTFVPEYGDRRPVVFFPELIDDFETYESNLAGCEFVPMDSIETAETTGTSTVAVYASYREEIGATLDAISVLLDEGVSPQAIVVTAVEAPEIAAAIASDAAVRGIPLRVQAGTAVPDIPGGSIFRRIDEAIGADFSIHQFAALLLDRSIPWRAPQELSRLADLGFESHCYSATEWRRSFALAGPVGDDLRERYSSVTGALQRMSRATTFLSLRASVRAFFDRQVDHSAWEPGAERVYETALTLLEEAAGQADSIIADLSPWRLFVSLLGERRYVARSPEGAVTLYDYRVAAGIEPDYHFIIGLSQAATRIRDAAPMGVTAGDRDRLGWDAADRSGAFVSAYQASGKTIVVSAARVGPRSAHIPVVSLDAVEGSTPVDRERWWRELDASPPPSLSPAERAGIEHFLATGFAPTGINYQATVVPAAALHRLRPVEYLSATALETFHACPFAYFLRYRLGIDTDAYGFRGVEGHVRGTLYHAALEAAVSAGAANEGACGAAEVRAIVESVVRRPGIARGVPPWMVPALVDRVTADSIWTLEAIALIRGDAPVEVEAVLTAATGGVPIRGTIDLLVDTAGGAAIIDYKTGRAPTFTEVWGASDDATEPDFTVAARPQLPFYATLAEQARNVSVDRIAFLLPRDRKVRWIADGSGRKQQRAGAVMLGAAREHLPRHLATVWERISSGDYRCDVENDCGGCRWRSVCRRCFVVRLPGGAA